MAPGNTNRRERPGALRRALVGALALMLVGIRPGGALDFACVESSRYKYLAAAFDDDLHKLADYLGTDRSALPPPEACRAVVATGSVVAGDPDRLVEAIAGNHGWLSVLYLGSGGGSVGAGLRLALLTRAFWLKTTVSPARSFKFQPDFFPLQRGGLPADPRVAAFEAAVRAVPATSSPAFCASACSFPLVAGIDRHGTALLHRAGSVGDSIETVSETVALALRLMTGLYRKMDVGEDFVRTARETAKQTTTPVPVPRYPSFVEDALLERCNSDPAQLDDVAALLEYARGAAGRTYGIVSAAPLGEAMKAVALRSRAMEQCVARLNEKERLGAFKKICEHGCSGKSLEPVLSRQINDLKG